jgi:hypothetical protein
MNYLTIRGADALRPEVIDSRIADVEGLARWLDYAFVMPGGFRFVKAKSGGHFAPPRQIHQGSSRRALDHRRPRFEKPAIRIPFAEHKRDLITHLC